MITDIHNPCHEVFRSRSLTLTGFTLSRCTGVFSRTANPRPAFRPDELFSGSSIDVGGHPDRQPRDNGYGYYFLSDIDICLRDTSRIRTDNLLLERQKS